MKGKPLLSVGIPCYNEEKYLEKTLNSILSQSFEDYVVYVCDDCSTDNSLAVAKRFAAQDSRIQVFHSEVRTNFVENWTRSLKICTTKYFCWIGAHDILHEDYFHDAIEILEHNSSTVMVYPLSVSIDAEGHIGESADSDLVTVGMKQGEAALKMAQNLRYCTAIHGVFKSAVLKKVPIKRILGFDFLILFVASLYGEITSTKKVRFYRRIVRRESHSDAVKRWEKAGMFDKTKYKHHEVLVSACLMYYLKTSTSFPLERFKVARKLLKSLAAKFHLGRRSILKCFLNI